MIDSSSFPDWLAVALGKTTGCTLQAAENTIDHRRSDVRWDPGPVVLYISVAMSAREGWPIRLRSQRISLTRVVSMMCCLRDCALAKCGGIEGAQSDVDDEIAW